jgi:hypothetical protein
MFFLAVESKKKEKKWALAIFNLTKKMSNDDVSLMTKVYPFNESSSITTFNLTSGIDT